MVLLSNILSHAIEFFWGFLCVFLDSCSWQGTNDFDGSFPSWDNESNHSAQENDGFAHSDVEEHQMLVSQPRQVCSSFAALVLVYSFSLGFRLSYCQSHSSMLSLIIVWQFVHIMFVVQLLVERRELSLKKREAHRGAKGPEARGASLEAKAHASRTRGALLLKKIKKYNKLFRKHIMPK